MNNQVFGGYYHASVILRMSGIINVLLIDYYVSTKVLAKEAGISYKTFCKVKRGDVKVSYEVYVDVYSVLAMYHNYTVEQVLNDLDKCNQAGVMPVWK
ncbi:MAG: hypothetical protein IJ628_07460 [Bacteroidaceae bacterium]|nr:hypothetical protein [Bacteroidaceae bacterium]